ncbi:hypothetical protein QO002_002910 [Pararhizobium capsulatum DSM 1112]|uniref:Uncharacterized protein n=1 Tax=Pararhizobium capsulatum DSM 1112 TaxID=1121113 RepID=A0ABU0BRA1_9HYPH|nr:hypothetical protein [Pararhizobium capsulatum]MDQ0320772.1 hypothetical protein [Pararhizobium capsulatum DSM 1112]
MADQEHDRYPVIEGVAFREYLEVHLKGYGMVRISVDEAQTYDDFCVACMEQRSAVFEPMSDTSWAVRLATAIHKGNEE